MFAMRLSSAVLVAAAVSIATAQPIPVPGTVDVPNEYGGTFPKEIFWEKDRSKMILIPFGKFKRGRPPARDVNEEESPEREIYVSSFYISKYEITNDQYERYLKEGTGAQARISGNPLLRDPKRPVSGIPWTSAEGYAQWAGLELPTEAQWEKAARGPEGSLYVGGNTPPDPKTVAIGRSTRGATDDYETTTTDQSGYGVMHMGGNVSEWVRDWYLRDAFAASSADNPAGPENGETKVIRGGHFYARPETARTTARTAGPVTQNRDELGFRTVWVPKPVDKSKLPTPTTTPVPLPTRDEIVESMLKSITPYLKANAPKLPTEMVAGRAYTSKGFADVQFINLTPYSHSLTFVGPNESLVFRYADPLPPMTYRIVSLPVEVDLAAICYSPNSERKEPMVIGSLRAESRAQIVLRTEMFSPLLDAKGAVIEMTPTTVAEQYYDEFQPLWTTLEVMNGVDSGIVFRIQDIRRNPTEPEMIGEFTLDPGKMMRITLQPSRYRLSSDYIGAAGESSTPIDLRLDDRAAQRLITVRPDATRPDTVAVITERKPFLALNLTEAKKVAFSRADNQATQDAKKKEPKTKAK